MTCCRSAAAHRGKRQAYLQVCRRSRLIKTPDRISERPPRDGRARCPLTYTAFDIGHCACERSTVHFKYVKRALVDLRLNRQLKRLPSSTLTETGSCPRDACLHRWLRLLEQACGRRPRLPARSRLCSPPSSAQSWRWRSFCFLPINT